MNILTATLGIKVVFVHAVPTLDYPAPRLAALHTRFPFVTEPAASRLDHARRTEPVRQVLQQLGGRLETIDPAPAVIAWGRLCTPQGEMLYLDKSHLSRLAALRLQALFEPLFYALSPMKTPVAKE